MAKNVPRDLETIAFKCMEKSPARRYASAQELADDLDRFLRHEPIRRPAGLSYRGWKYARRRPMAVALGSTMLIGELLIAGLIGEGRRRPDDGRRPDCFGRSGHCRR